MTDRKLAIAVCVLLVSACSGLAYAPVRFANGVMTNISDGLYGATVDSMLEVLDPQ